MKATSIIERKAYDKGVKAGIHKATSNMISAMVLVLADKFSFDEDRLVKAVDYFNETFDEINDGRITVFDIVETLRAEYGIHVEIGK